MKCRALFSPAAAVTLLLSILSLHAADEATPAQATVRAVHGDVTWQTNGGPAQPLRVNAKLDAGAIVVTGTNSSANLSVNGASSTIRVDAGTKLELSKMHCFGSEREGDRETYLRLKTGSILGHVERPSEKSRFEIEMPQGVAGIRGPTDFQIDVVPGPEWRVIFTCITGQMLCVDGCGNLKILSAGDFWRPGDPEVHHTDPAPAPPP